MKRDLSLLLVIVLTMAGFALRLHGIGRSSFRGDEAFTVINWVRPALLPTLASDIPVKDPQPPLAYALIHGWGRVFGESETMMRLLPALVSTLGIPVLYALGRRISGQVTGILAALFWAMNPLQIWHAQDARNYALWATTSAAALWLALRALDKQRRIDWVLYIAAAACAAYLYYLELFVIVVLNLYVLVARVVLRRDWHVFQRWIAAQIVIALLLAPWYVQERLLVSSGYGGTRGGGVDPLRLLTDFLPSLTFGTTLPQTLTSWLWPLLLVVLLIGLWILRRNRFALLVGMLGTIPLLLLALVSLRLDVFVPRYVLAAAPAYVLILANLAAWLWISRAVVRRFVSIALFAGFLLVSGYSLYNYFGVADYAKVADWRTMSEYLHEHITDDDQVIQAAADEALTFYYADVDRLPANPNQSADEIIATLEDRRASHASLWLVARTFPDWPNRDVVPGWLAENMQLVRETSAGGLPVWQYKSWEVSPGEITGTSLAQYGDVAELVGIEIQREQSELFVWAHWRSIRTTDEPLKIFVHLIGDSSTPLRAQDDQFPQDGRVSTDSWAVNEVYRDVYRLNLKDVPAGDYTVVLGLYDPEGGQRVPVGDSDAYAIGTITIP